MWTARPRGSQGSLMHPRSSPLSRGVGAISKTPSGCPKPQVVPNPVRDAFSCGVTLCGLAVCAAQRRWAQGGRPTREGQSPVA